MAKTNWTISGRLRLSPSLEDVADAFGSTVDLSGVAVRVRAKQRSIDPQWQTWGESVTDAEGRFSVKKLKDKTKRHVRIDVKFQNDKLNIYGNDPTIADRFLNAWKAIVPGRIDDWSVDLADDAVKSVLEQTSRITQTVKWLTIYESDDRFSPSEVNLGNLTFETGMSLDLGRRDPRCHAEIWFLIQRYIDYVNSFDHGFRTDRPIAIKYPHDNAWIGDGVESSYANPQNDCVYLVRNSRRDQFDTGTIFHEIEHLRAYQHTTGEVAMAGVLLLDQNTHTGELRQPFVGWHEAWAEVMSNEIYRRLFGTMGQIYDLRYVNTGLPIKGRRRPIARPYLRSLGIRSLDDLDRYEFGWISAFSLLMCHHVRTLDMETELMYAENTVPGSGRSPNEASLALTPGEFARVLDHGGRGSDGTLNRSNLNLRDFFDLVEHVIDRCTPELIGQYLAILDPSETRQPSEIMAKQAEQTGRYNARDQSLRNRPPHDLEGMEAIRLSRP